MLLQGRNDRLLVIPALKADVLAGHTWAELWQAGGQDWLECAAHLRGQP